MLVSSYKRACLTFKRFNITHILKKTKIDRNCFALSVYTRCIQMVKFETIKSDEVKFGANNFIEIARKKAITEEGENVFISISRGFVDKNGNRRYRTSISLPLSADVVDFVSQTIRDMGAGAEAASKHTKRETKRKEKDEENEEDLEEIEEEDEE